MKAYKGFNKDMTCRGFQYREGETYHEDEARLCECGFHACLDPLDCFFFYHPSESVYHEVDVQEVDDSRDPFISKVCAKTITIGRELSVGEIYAKHVLLIRARCPFRKPEKLVETDAP